MFNMYTQYWNAIENNKNCDNCEHYIKRKEIGLMHRPCKACVMYSQSTGTKCSEWIKANS